MQNTNKIVMNSVFLYLKMIITIIVSLFSTRLLLKSLGEIDYGIFNLVAGVITLLLFINTAMTAASQRYMSLYMGKGNNKKLKQVFHSSVYMHLIIGLFILVVLEILSLFLFDGVLNIPESRIKSAKYVYHFMVISTFFTINAVPYDAAINSNENMLFDSLVGVFESFMKLGLAIWLLYYHNDKLIFYGGAFAVIIIVIRTVKSFYCYLKYPECKFSFSIKIDKVLFKEMFSFSRWSIFGVLASVGRNQGVAIVLNLFLGTIINSAYAISNQVTSLLNTISFNLLKAINPQIMKNEGAKEREKMLFLAMKSNKFSFLLLSFLAVPLIFEMPVILKLWLINIPEYTIVFSRIILISVLVNQLTIGSQTALQAIGKIKAYQSVVGGLLLLNVPMAYLILKQGYSPYVAISSFILIEFLACTFRLYFLNKLADLSIILFFKKVIIPGIIPMIASLIISLAITSLVMLKYRFILTTIVSSIVFLTIAFMFSLDKQEKLYIKNIIKIK